MPAPNIPPQPPENLTDDMRLGLVTCPNCKGYWWYAGHGPFPNGGPYSNTVSPWCSACRFKQIFNWLKGR